ncbi:hypothetical protein CspeluHIS016_0505310 [Cutaneotrichosporon spelunceum]|uniref:LSM domain-containing protein n=1 Tax=Cutaneotrichosporon spelunceum TaxID=1672016 RepID=A0AAD3TX93_9TREE|nr:hypothetical protein CspeluHIS016_0505310 [Cutaneotrichosporon spelunceum]
MVSSNPSQHPESDSSSMANHPFSGTPRHRSPRPNMPVADALRALLHTLLTVTLNDGRVLTGHLLAVDSSASLLLGSAQETRFLPSTEVGANVAQYYPWSRAEGVASTEPGGQVREREITSVLINMRDIVAVEMSEQDAGAWSFFTGTPFDKGHAVPPTPPIEA